MKLSGKRLISVLEGKTESPPPVWLMRQAGRYLPEYRELRAKAGSFWTMCNDPQMAAEITLQPIRRFGFDAAIIFSDILTVPFALGRTVTFEENIGPRLDAVDDLDSLERDPEVWRSKLTPAYETLARVRAELPPETALLGFAGAPWTLATYMAAGRGGDEQKAAKLWGYRRPESFDALLNLLGDCVAEHLIAQIDVGADAVQIFDSWAGGLPADAFARWVVAPTKRIVDKVRVAKPDAKIIGFPRATTLRGYESFARETGVNGISVDTSAPSDWMAKLSVPVQGNLDPLLLVTGGAALDRAVDDLVHALHDKPFIFNLGHGVLQETPPEHVAALVARLRS